MRGRAASPELVARSPHPDPLPPLGEREVTVAVPNLNLTPMGTTLWSRRFRTASAERPTTRVAPCIVLIVVFRAGAKSGPRLTSRPDPRAADR